MGYIFLIWFILGLITMVVILFRTDAEMYFTDIYNFLFEGDMIGFIFRLIALYFILPLALIKLLEK